VKDRVGRINGVGEKVGSERFPDDDLEGFAFFARTLVEEIVIDLRDDGPDEWHKPWIAICDTSVSSPGRAELDRHGGPRSKEVGRSGHRRQELAEPERSVGARVQESLHGVLGPVRFSGKSGERSTCPNEGQLKILRISKFYPIPRCSFSDAVRRTPSPALLPVRQQLDPATFGRPNVSALQVRSLRRAEATSSFGRRGPWHSRGSQSVSRRHRPNRERVRRP